MGKKLVMSRKRILIIATVVVLFFVIAGGLFIWVRFYMTPPEAPAGQSELDKAAASSKQAAADGKLRDTAAQDIKSNNAAAAQKTYDAAIKNEASIERKTLLYIDLSGVYYDAGQYDQAIAVAKTAEAANSDKFLIADWLSRIYEDQKDYIQAAKYYKIAGQSANSPQNKTAINKAYYDGKADEMTKLAAGGTQ